MSVIDRRVEEVKKLEARLPMAATFGKWMSLVVERHALRQELRAEEVEVNRVARGWTYLPLPKLR